MTGPLSALLAARRVLHLDGGLATELQRHGHDLHDPLWSAKLLLTRPEAIAAVHTAYLHAGADIVTTATYQASHAALHARGLDRDAIDAVLQRASALALDARDAFAQAHPQRVRAVVATSVGPYGAAQADGSEYTGRYGRSVRELADFHRLRLTALARHAEVLACETIPNVDEAHALAIVLAQVLPEHPGVEAWVSFSCRDDARLADGSPIEDAVAPLRTIPGVVALGVNCTAPHHVGALIQRLVVAAPGHAVVAYPNAGERWDPGAHAWDGAPLSPDAFARLAQDWIAAGARIVGGCCRTTPAHIAALPSSG